MLSRTLRRTCHPKRARLTSIRVAEEAGSFKRIVQDTDLAEREWVIWA